MSRFEVEVVVGHGVVRLMSKEGWERTLEFAKGCMDADRDIEAVTIKVVRGSHGGVWPEVTVKYADGSQTTYV